MESLDPAIAALVGMVSTDTLVRVARALVIVVVGLALARLASSGVDRLFREVADRQNAQLVRRVAYWLVLLVTLALVLAEFGFTLGVLLGAAGILSVAIGFASQTSASNIISGLFLLGEKPFRLGDVIQIGDVTGEVLSIDLLSVKLRTFQNAYVRVPNEWILKERVHNLTRFAIRRVDIPVTVEMETDLATVERVFQEMVARQPLVLEEPEPFVMVGGFGQAGVDLTLAMWCEGSNFLAVRAALIRDLQTAFPAAGIRFPFPQLVVHRAPAAPPATDAAPP